MSLGLSHLKTVPLPAGLPAPVERFYRKVYGDAIPVITSAVLTGRGFIKLFLNVPLPIRFVFIHQAGKSYRHYIEITLINLPVVKVDEGYVDGRSFFESPMGNSHDDPNTNQAANLGMWAESAWFPAIFLTDTRVRWVPVDAHAALLTVPYGLQTETFFVRFNPDTGLIDLMEAMRHKYPKDKRKVLWLSRFQPQPTLPGSPLGAAGLPMWLDEGRPWARFTVEDIVYNVDVAHLLTQRGFKFPVSGQ